MLTLVSYLEKELINTQWPDGAHDLSHFYRVRQNGLLLSKNMDCNQLIVEVACLLHDIVNLPKDSPQRKQAALFSSNKAEIILKEYRSANSSAIFITDEFISKVCEAIRYHSYSAEISSLSPLNVGVEALCVQDADRLDAIGHIGIARCFYVCGSMGGEICSLEDPLAINRPLDDRKYGLDHFPTKLTQLQNLMKTPQGKEMAINRTQIIIEFRSKFLSSDFQHVYLLAKQFYSWGKDKQPLERLKISFISPSEYIINFVEEYNKYF